MKTVSIEMLVDQVLRANVPVLFLDTCIPLDVIRSTKRELARYAEHAVQILKKVDSSPPECVLVIASIIPREWQSHVQNVFDDVQRHLREIEKWSIHFHDACEAVGIDVGAGRTAYAELGLAEKLRDVAERLLSDAIQIEEDAQCLLKAHRRVKNGLPPSRNGAEMKDCTIVEEYLAVSRKLQELGHAKNRVFCTSNDSDYCDNQKRLHKNLAVDFADVGLTFTSKLSWAIYELTRELEPNTESLPQAEELTGNSDS